MTDIPADVSTISFSLEVATTSDDDFIGWAVGFDAGEGSDAAAEWLLFDWKQANQTKSSCEALAGLAVSTVTGALTSTDEWCRAGSVTELDRGATLGGTGWVDGTLELDLTGTFPTGAFGFYTYSQASSRCTSLRRRTGPSAVATPVGAAPAARPGQNALFCSLFSLPPR